MYSTNLVYKCLNDEDGLLLLLLRLTLEPSGYEVTGSFPRRFEELTLGYMIDPVTAIPSLCWNYSCVGQLRILYRSFTDPLIL
jgi:hypothetical protein